MTEKRREVRNALPLTAFVQVTQSETVEPGTTFSATVAEVSSLGLRIRSGQYLEEGHVELFVKLPSGERLFIAADVRWGSANETDYEAGLEVVDELDALAWRQFQDRFDREALVDVC